MSKINRTHRTNNQQAQASQGEKPVTEETKPVVAEATLAKSEDLGTKAEAPVEQAAPQEEASAAPVASATETPAAAEETLEDDALSKKVPQEEPAATEVTEAAEQVAPVVPAAAEPTEPVKVEPVVEVTEAPVAAAPLLPGEGKPWVEPAAKPASEEEAYLEDVRENGTEVQKRILAAVETFAEKLKPRSPITPSECSKCQYEFLGHLSWAMKKDYEDFRKAWNVLLVYFFVNHGTSNSRDYTALSEFSTNRYLSAWTKGAESCMVYANLITLLRATRNAKTRKHDIRTIDLNKVGAGYLSPEQIENLKKFYNV